MAKVVTVRPDNTWSVDEITDSSRTFLEDVYKLIGNGCDFIEAVRCGDGIFMLVDEEPFRRDPMPPSNAALVPFLRMLGKAPIHIQGAAVFVGETDDESDLAGLTDGQLRQLRAAAEAVIS